MEEEKAIWLMCTLEIPKDFDPKNPDKSQLSVKMQHTYFNKVSIADLLTMKEQTARYFDFLIKSSMDEAKKDDKEAKNLAR